MEGSLRSGQGVFEMNSNAHLHKIVVLFRCEEFDRLTEGARITGFGDDIENYIRSIIAERC